MLNRIALYYSIDKTNSLDSQIKQALASWNVRKETKDLIPQYLVFSLEESHVIELDKIAQEHELEVCFRKDVTRNHFKIEGDC